MTMTDVDTVELRALVARLDQMLSEPAALAATDANGNPGTVAAGELIESAWGNAVVTHVVRSGPVSARPATAHPGAKWYSTDDKKEYTYHAGNGWMRSDWNASWGHLAEASFPGDLGNGTGATETPILVVAAPLYTEGRKTRVTMTGTYLGSNVVDNFWMRIRRGSGTTGTGIVTASIHIHAASYNVPFNLQGEDQMTVANGTPSQYVFTIQRVDGSAGGNMTIKGTNSGISNKLVIEDVGPVTRI